MDTAAEVHADHDDVHYTDAERNAMRGFLQRCEVRISTQHRIATAFIGGAGLLLLIPIFFRDIVDGILIVLLQTIGNYFASLGVAGGWITSLVLFALLVYPFFLSLAVPLYSLYLMLKDIVHFYFSLYTPGMPNNVLNPSFSLTGLAFPEDESGRVRRAVNRFQYDTENSNYMIPFSEKRRGQYFDQVIEDTGGGIFPAARRPDHLYETGSLPPDVDPKHAARVSAAFGLARSVGRTLVEEVAVAEMLLARNNMYLRRLLLRYVKTLLMFVWTTLLSFLMLPFLGDTRFPTLLVLAVSYVVWSIGVMPIVGTPFKWIYKHRYSRDEAKHIDQQLTLLERNIAPFARLSVVASLVALVMSAAAYLI